MTTDRPPGFAVAATWFTGTTVLLLVQGYLDRCRQKRRIRPRTKAETDLIFTKDPAMYDAVVVGAGPAGATAAYYMGLKGLRVALIDKKEFPRHKPCGDAWCKPALDLLEEMGILQKMETDGVVKAVQRGGFISPFGYECINTDNTSYGAVTGCKTYAIKRYIADNYLVQAAARLPTVDFFPGMEVTEVVFTENIGDSEAQLTGYNTVRVLGIAGMNFYGKICLVCDGSTSYLAQKLGIIEKGTQPQAVCSHAYIRGNSHNWQGSKSADGVMVFNKAVLPGYSALFRHYNDDVYLGTYILPGGKATSRAIAPFEAELVTDHPYVKDAFGEKYEWEEKRIVAPIRCGGVKKSYGRQLLLVGDAAGHVDPLTGEGIHTAMVAGKIAAQCVQEMTECDNFSEDACKAYELRCYDAFGYEFFSSSLAAKIIYAMPIALDAVAVVGQRRGQAFLDFFGEVMTGVRPKSDFAQLGLLCDIGLELLKQVWIQYILRTPPLIPSDIGQEVVNKQAGKKTGGFA